MDDLCRVAEWGRRARACGVNVNTTDATTGATALLLPAPAVCVSRLPPVSLKRDSFQNAYMQLSAAQLEKFSSHSRSTTRIYTIQNAYRTRTHAKLTSSAQLSEIRKMRSDTRAWTIDGSNDDSSV